MLKWIDGDKGIHVQEVILADNVQPTEKFDIKLDFKAPMECKAYRAVY